MHSDSKLSVAVLHALRPASRKTTVDHILSFAEIGGIANTYFVHASQPITKSIANLEVDIFIVNYDFLNYRFTPMWEFIKDSHKEIASKAKYRVAVVQDDFWAHLEVDDWIQSWKIDKVLTPIDSNLEILYPKSYSNTKFQTVLTGYASKPDSLKPSRALSEREIDLGQRVRAMPPSLGRYAQEKYLQATIFAEFARSAGFTVDVSTDPSEALLGSKWQEFLRNSKFTVSMKGGASLPDPRGLLHHKVARYMARHPNSDFDVIERKCFKGLDMNYVFSAISPRLFEAAEAKTCQILREDDYLGVLKPWVHYLPLKKDLSNSQEILSYMKDLNFCQEVADNCFETLITSKKFTHENLINSILSEISTMKSDSKIEQKVRSDLNEHSLLATNYSVALHDAVWLLLYDLEMLNTTKVIVLLIEQIDSFFRNLEDAFLEVNPRLSAKSESMTVLKLLDDLELTGWFLRRLIEVTSGQTAKLQIWNWRPPIVKESM